MALINLHVFSNSLQMQTEIEVVIPQKDKCGEIGVNGKVENQKTLYLLHGLSDDQTIWCRRTSIERYAEEYGVCVVMPCGGRSFYFNQKNGENYYDYIAKELPQLISQFFHVSNKREDRYIAGLSMGGYGALKIALKENETFCAGAGLSTVADINVFKDHLVNVVKDEKDIAENDLFKLVEQKANEPQKPRLFMWCGTEDFLYDSNVKLKDYIANNFNYDFVYNECEGNHSWPYWDEQIKNVLNWMFKK